MGELEQKVSELTKKYYMASNPELRQQVVTLLNMYTEELSAKRAQEFKKFQDKHDKGLDKLIKID